MRQTLRPVLLAGLALLAGAPLASPAAAAELRLHGAASTVDGLVAPNAAAVERQTGVALQVEKSNAGKGLRDLIDGRAGAALASASLEATVQAARQAGLQDPIPPDLQLHVLASSEVVFVVHPSNPVRSLTAQQLADLHAGRIASWKEVGGPDRPVVVYTDALASATRGLVRQAVLRGADYAPGAVAVERVSQVADRVAADPGGIGALGREFADPARVAVVQAPKVERPLGFITRGAPSPELVKVMDAFRAAATGSGPSPAAAPAAPPAPAGPKASAPAFAPRATAYGFIDYQFSRVDRPAPGKDSSSFELRRARIGLKGDVTREIGFNVLWDGADSALKDAYAALRYLPGAELRLGQFKTPFGYEQQEADTRLLWVYSSYVVQALARGKDSRDEGVGLFGRWKLAGPLSLEVNAAGVNGAGPNTKDDLDEKNFWGRAGLVLAAGGTTTRLGGSYGTGRQVQSLGADGKLGLQATATPTFDDTTFFFHAAGADLTFDSPWVFVAAEWIQSRRHVTRHTAPDAATVTDLTARGWYVGAYGKTPWNLGPVFRAERARLPTSAGTALADGWWERYTVGAYYDVVPVTARLVLNYELDESPRPVRTGDRFIAFAQVMF